VREDFHSRALAAAEKNENHVVTLPLLLRAHPPAAPVMPKRFKVPEIDRADNIEEVNEKLHVINLTMMRLVKVVDRLVEHQGITADIFKALAPRVLELEATISALPPPQPATAPVAETATTTTILRPRKRRFKKTE